MRDQATAMDVPGPHRGSRPQTTPNVEVGPPALDASAAVPPPGSGEPVAGVGSADGVGARPGLLRALITVGPHIRLLDGMRRPANWLQLIRFAIVGGTGFALNLAIYALLVHPLGIEYQLAAAAAWIIAGANNFVWNRHWTFKARHGQVHVQALRFLIVSLLALGFNELVLTVLVEAGGLSHVAGQVLALGASTPLNFLGNKLWSFR